MACGGKGLQPRWRSKIPGGGSLAAENKIGRGVISTASVTLVKHKRVKVSRISVS